MDKKIYVILDENQLQILEEIKKHLGLKKDPEVFRFLLAYYYKRVFEEKVAACRGEV
ncbi:MAG: hypothetical protein QXE06_06915 [Candidatus Bathyarchaeia archaeon]